jgi:hypothetical protein
MSDTITLELQGTVSLTEYAAAVERFSKLVVGLSVELGSPDIGWELDNLEVASAITTARGLTGNGTAPEDVARVATAYLEVGRALAGGTTVPFQQAVTREANALRGLIGGRVTAIVFQTAEADVVIADGQAPAPVAAIRFRSAYGAVTGRIQTLTSRSRLRFTLYDRLYDRPVACFVPEGSESLMRGIWDRMATVQGWVSRDPQTGRPRSVRGITNILPVQDEGAPSGYLKARGASPRAEGGPRAEERIRRLRNDG